MDITTANRLYELRKQHGYSQDELADKLGLTKSCVNHRLRKITEIASRLP